MKGLREWLRNLNGPLIEAGAVKVILVLISALVGAKLLPGWVESVALSVSQALGWI